MNSLNPLENQLRRWTPRPPSPRLKALLFNPASPKPITEPVRWNPRVLIPVPAVLGLAFSLWLWVMSYPAERVTSQSDSWMETAATGPGRSRDGTMWAMNIDRNTWSSQIFEWTNGGTSVFGKDSFRLFNTNGLRF